MTPEQIRKRTVWRAGLTNGVQMKAIRTKYHGPTNFKSSRVSAEAEGVGRMYFRWNSHPHRMTVRWFWLLLFMGAAFMLTVEGITIVAMKNAECYGCPTNDCWHHSECLGVNCYCLRQGQERGNCFYISPY